MKPSYLVRGFRGHPLHPPVTDATIHGMRVLNLVDEPTERAMTPGHPEKERAEGG